MPITNPGMSQVQVMTESMNLDSNELVGSLEEFESLETIQAELERLNEERQACEETSQDEMQMLEQITKDEEMKVKIEKMEEEIEIEITPEITEQMIEENIAQGMTIIHQEVVEDEESKNIHLDSNLLSHESHSQSQDLSDESHGLFSEETIEDERVIIDGVTQSGVGSEEEFDDCDGTEPPQIYDDEMEHEEITTTEEEMLCTQDTMEEVTSENVLSEETVIDDVDPLLLEPMQVSSESYSIVAKSSPPTAPPAVATIPMVSTPSLIQTVVPSKPAPSSGVYVVSTTSSTFIGAQSILQANTLLSKENNQKLTRMLLTNEGGTQQAIRILSTPGKLLGPGATAKTITLEQAKQMGIISSSNHLIPGAMGKAVGKVMVPGPKKTVTVVKSPTKILPAPSPNVQSTIQTVQTVGGTKTQKVLIRQANPLKPGTILATPTTGQVIRIPSSQALTPGNIHQIQLPGKQVQYVKLVGAGSNKSQGTLVPVSALSKSIPVALPTSLLNSSQQTAFKVVPMSAQQGSGTTQRVLIPASAVSQAANAGQNSQSLNNIVMLSPHLLQPVKKQQEKVTLPGVSTIRTTTNGRRASTPSVKLKESGPSSSIVSSVVTNNINVNSNSSCSSSGSLTNNMTSVATTTNLLSNSNNNNSSSGSTGILSSGGSSTNLLSSMVRMETKQESSWSGDESISALEANGIRPRKPCNCTKSLCLKLYCDCFANGEFCNQCNCTYCYNNLEHEEDRQRAIRSCLERNPTAFRPKIGKSVLGSDERRHNKGCNCRRSGCLKNYCECYEAKIPCSKNCKCIGCKNLEGCSGRRGESEERTNFKSKLSEPTLRSQESTAAQRQAFNLLTMEVVQATCQCLLAQAEDWEKDKSHQSGTSKGGGTGNTAQVGDLETVESLIIQEFGRCVVQIIDCVNKSQQAQHT